jgi:hypothetical protein
MSTNSASSKKAVFITRKGMGTAPEELSMLLLKNYLTLLKSESSAPTYICLYAEGVMLSCKGSPVSDELRALEADGTKILSCKTCLNFYEMAGNLEVGIAGTMLDILEIQNICPKIITL